MIAFNLHKTIEAAAYLIKRQYGAQENYMRLLKLLYLAERSSIAKRGVPICGDTPYAMKKGPVMSTTLDLIKGKDPLSQQWDYFIEKDEFTVRLKEDPGNLHLSRADINVLEDVAVKFREFDEWDLVDWCHKNLPEYEKNWAARGNRESRRISLDDLLESVGRLNDKESILADLKEDSEFGAMFKDHMPALKEQYP